jgi:hypothetical protein
MGEQEWPPIGGGGGVCGMGANADARERKGGNTRHRIAHMFAKGIHLDDLRQRTGIFYPDMRHGALLLLDFSRQAVARCRAISFLSFFD